MKLKSVTRNPAHRLVFAPSNVDKFNAKPSAIPPFGIRMQNLLTDMNFDTTLIAESKLSIVPPWELAVPNVNLSCKIGKKDCTNAFDFLTQFYMIANVYSNYQFIYTDGSKSGDKVGCAAVTTGSPYKIRLPDRCSVYTAELQAIKLALIHIKRSRQNDFVICSDSLSALQAIENRDIHHPIVLDILTQYHWLVRRCSKVIVFLWVPSHMGIPGNDVSFCRVPHKVTPTLGPCTPIYDMSGRDQLVMARSRIGHTYLTQGYLLRGEEVPMCVTCRERVTVEHILVRCTDFDDIRRRFYQCHCLHDLFANHRIYDILNFLREIGVYFYF